MNSNVGNNSKNINLDIMHCAHDASLNTGINILHIHQLQVVTEIAITQSKEY